MVDPKITVIIPTYNRWPYVCQAIDSVLKQSYLNAECLVVDDASTDGSYEKLRNKYGERIVLLRNEENKERSYSRNRGVIECNADFICFLDSDDILTQNSIEQRLRTCCTNIFHLSNFKKPLKISYYQIRLNFTNGTFCHI